MYFKFKISDLNSDYGMGRLGEEKKLTWIIRFWLLGWLDLASKMTGYKFIPIALNGKLK